MSSLSVSKLRTMEASPTYRQIGDACDVSSSSMVSRYLFEMIELEMITRDGKFRNINIPGSRWLAPTHLKVNAEKAQKQEAKKLHDLLEVVSA